MARIEDYALIGDCETAALVSRRGSIDWLCWPRFDSPACFAALVGDTRNGRWLMEAADPDARVTRRYRPETLILETRWDTEEGAVTIIDFMPPRGTNSDVVRIVRGESGRVKMRTELVLRLEGSRAFVSYELRIRGATLEMDVRRPGLLGRLLAQGPLGAAPAHPEIVRTLRCLTLEKGIERVTLLGGALRAHAPLRGRDLALDRLMDVFGCLARIARLCHDRAAWPHETPPRAIEKSRSGSSRRDASTSRRRLRTRCTPASTSR